MSWIYLQNKASQFAEATEIQYFKPTPGWLQKVLNRNGCLSVDLHGETKDISKNISTQYSIIELTNKSFPKIK